MTKRLLYLNGLAVLGVLTNHSVAWVYIALFWWTHRYSPVQSPNFDQLFGIPYYMMRSLEQLIIVSIPAFLAVSGFFVAFATRKGSDSPGWRFIGNRIRYLGIPYLIWSLITIVTNIFQGEEYTLLDFGRILLIGDATPAFYFVPLIIQLYLLSALLTHQAKKHWKPLLLLTGSIQFVVMVSKYVLILDLDTPISPVLSLLTSGWFFPGNLFWFTAGIVFGFHHTTLKPVLIRLRWILFGLWLALWGLGVLEWEVLLYTSGQDWIGPRETLVDNLYALVFLMGFIAFEGVKLPLDKEMGNLGSKSFGVYLAHSLILTFAARGIYHLLPQFLGLPVVFWFFLMVLGLSIPLVLMAVVKNSPLQRVYTYIFG